MSKPKIRVYDAERNLMITEPSDPTKKLRQVETGAIYAEAIDVIVGYREENGEQVPYGRFTYEEIDKTPEELAAEQEAQNYALQHGEEEN